MCMWCWAAYSPVSCVTAPSGCVSCAATTSRRERCWMEVAAMNSLDTLLPGPDQGLPLPVRYRRQGITTLPSAIHLAARGREARAQRPLLGVQPSGVTAALV